MSFDEKRSALQPKNTVDSLNYLVNWENLRLIGSSPFASISIVMPFIGFAILYNDQIASLFFELGVGMGVDATVNNSRSEPVADGILADLYKFFELELIARLNFLYVGAVLIGVGTILFRMRAPKTVQRHNSIESLLNSELDRASARSLRTMVSSMQKQCPNVANELVEYAPWLDSNGLKSLSIAYAEAREERDQQIHADVLSSFYEVESRYRNRKSAWLVMLLYCLGIALAAVPGLCFTAQVLISIAL